MIPISFCIGGTELIPIADVFEMSDASWGPSLAALSVNTVACWLARETET
jgi:hypothetical protein